MQILTELRTALYAERLSLVFQPQISLHSGRVIGAEALLRWEIEPERWISPDRFIPLAEQSGLIVPLGEWVLRTACNALQHLNTCGHHGFRMAINVSHVQFREPDFVSRLACILAETQVAARWIELELTESIAMDHVENVNSKLTALRRLGFTIAIDDFGTGYSSLSVLKQLNIDRIKIDRSFIREIDELQASASIAQLIIALGHQRNLTLIAEGVENEAQRQCLLALGCQEAQGFLFARPVPLAQLEKWMATQITL